MRERERIERKRFQEEHDKIEAAERAERERPIREAEAALQQTAAQLGKIERENVLSLPDSQFKLPEAVKKLRMTKAEAEAFNAAESASFRRSTPDYYPCQDNFDLITSYLLRNGVVIANAETFKLAFERLRDLGLLRERPEPEPQPEPEITIVPAAEIEQPQEPELLDGWDSVTGRPRQFTKYEADRMSAEEYKRSFRLVGDKLPRFIHP